MTVIRPNSVSGINSITAQANEIKIFKSDGTQGGLMIDGANLNATSGISTVAALTVTGNVSVGGTLTYQDVTNIDSVGIVTARSGINVTGGNVDIGGATHSRNLSVHDATNGVILIEGASNGTSNLMFADENDEDVGMLGYNHASNYLAFTVNAAERLRITSAGNIGIGTDIPYTNNSFNSLSIGGSGKYGLIELNKSDGVAGSWIDVYGTNGNGDLRFTTAGTSGAITFWTGGSFTEKVRITSDGRLGIGTDNPGYNLELHGASGVANLKIGSRITNSDYGVAFGYFDELGGKHGFGIDRKHGGTLTTDAFVLRADTGKVGINYDSPSYMLEVHNDNPGNDSKQLIQKWVNTNQNTLELHMYGGTVDQCQFAATNSEQTLSFLTGVASGNVDSTETSLLLTQARDAWFQGLDASNYGGGLFIGREASPYGNLCALRDNNRRPLIYMGGKYPEITLAHTVASNTSHGPTIRFATYVQSTNTATGSQFVIGTNGSGTFLDIGHATAAQNQNVHAGISNYNGTYRFRVTTSGCQVNGSLSKSSGSFRIDHPLAGLSTTRDLVHSFIEGPQADLIYRGVVDLVDGTATVNIDTAGRMTEGTFEVLCTNVSCFTSNETDWTAVKGSVSGNILTITAQDNTSTATVSWMVVGERKDPHMIDTDWTDENGRVITEPLKSS